MNQWISPDQNLQSPNERTKTLKTNELSQGPRRPKSTTLLRPALKINKQTLARMIMKASAFKKKSKASIQIAFPLTFQSPGSIVIHGKRQLKCSLKLQRSLC
jgi:hypothetical protein